MPHILLKVGMIEEEKVGSYLCLNKMGDRGYSIIDWSMRVFIVAASSFYVCSFNLFFYCKISDGGAKDCTDKFRILQWAKPFYVLIALIIIYFYSSAIWKIYSLITRTENKSLMPDMKVIWLHILCIVIMTLSILASVITGSLLNNAEAGDWSNLADIKKANDITSWVRLLFEPTIPFIYLYVFLNYGEKKNSNIASRIKS